MIENNGIIGWIIIGLIAGGIAKLLMPGKDPGGCLITILLGVAGALLAGLIGKSIGWYEQGEAAGFIAAISYDIFRLPFVFAQEWGLDSVVPPMKLFKVFPRFGELLLGADEPRWLVHLLGWGYHFSNGAALGIMFLCLAPRAGAKGLFWGAVAWALFVEAMLLLTPYPAFFGLPLDGRFIFLTVTAHLIFGVTLGLWLRRRLAGRRQTIAA